MNINKSRKTEYYNEERISPKKSSANEMTANRKVEVHTAQQYGTKGCQKAHINASENDGHYVDIQGNARKDIIDTTNILTCRVNGIK